METEQILSGRVSSNGTSNETPGSRSESTQAQLQKLSELLSALQSSVNLIDWEQQTGGAVWQKSGTGVRMTRRLQEIRRRMLLAEETGEVLRQAGKEPLLAADRVSAALIREIGRARQVEERLSDEQAEEQAELCERAGQAWSQAKKDSAEGKDSPATARYLECLDGQARLLAEAAKAEAAKAEAEGQGIAEYADAQAQDAGGYEIFLQDYEPCATQQEAERFFKECRKVLVPLLGRGREQGRDVFVPQESYAAERQEKLCHFLSEYLGFDFGRGASGQSAHPFTTALANDHVCLSAHFAPENPFAAIFTALHETGHALYEQNVAKDLKGTVLAGGASAGLHEAVARFYENCIGRMPAFWEPIYGKVAELLGGEFERLPFEGFMRAIRAVRPGALRTEADEVSYPFHIIIRYELEKRLFDGTLSATGLEEEWNRLYQDYLGIAPETPAAGYLQDIHWASGQFGYFPAYQLGNAMAAQVYHKVRQVLPLEGLLREGKLMQLLDYLTAHIFRFGLTKTSREILVDMTGEPLNTLYYLEYLKERYGA